MTCLIPKLYFGHGTTNYSISTHPLTPTSMVKAQLGVEWGVMVINSPSWRNFRDYRWILGWMYFCVAGIEVSVCCKVLVWSKLDLKSGLQSHASAQPMSAFSPVSESLFHWSVKATDSVRGDGGQTKLRQTVAIWETTVLCVPAPPHHCLPCVRIKGPIFHFCLLVFS